MRRLAALLAFTLPLLGQLPVGVTRMPYPADGPNRDPRTLIATADGVLWGASLSEAVLDRIAPDGTARSFEMPFAWGGTWDMTAGPDGAVWLGTKYYVARHDRQTNKLETWPFRVVRHVLSGSDGNIWLVLGVDQAQHQTPSRIVRMRTDGVVLETYDADADYPMDGLVSDAVFGSDGALWFGVSRPSRLVRLTTSGERTEFPAETVGELFAGPGFLWVGTSGQDGVMESPRDLVRIGLDGKLLGRYPLTMSPAGADAAGNLWLRERTAEGYNVARLTPAGVLTRFVPLSPMPTDECTVNWPGGFAVLPDGRVAMVDYYAVQGGRPEDYCFMGYQSEIEPVNVITILDPLVAPIASVQQINPVPRRRTSRH